MPDIKNFYGSTIDPLITLAGLGPDPNLLTGRQTAEVDNTVVRALDFLVSGRITVGSVTAVGSIEVWAIAAFDPTGTTYPDTFSSTDAARTWNNASIKNSGAAQLIYSVATTTAQNLPYPWSNISLASRFGGTCPPRFVFFVTHSTGVNLNSTANNHFIRVTPVYETVT